MRAVLLPVFLAVAADSITSLDQGFDDAGAHRWGPPPGAAGNAFSRRK